MSRPLLPELVDAVLGHLHDFKPTIGACSLVYHALRSLFYLFRTSVPEFMSTSSDIASQVRSLVVEDTLANVIISGPALHIQDIQTIHLPMVTTIDISAYDHNDSSGLPAVSPFPSCAAL